MKLEETKIEQLRGLLSKAKKVAIIPHKDPDGDAVGACMAWLEALQNNDYEVDVISPTYVPANLRWMKGYEKVIVFDENEKSVEQILNKADMFLFLDFNNISRTGNLSELLRTFKKKYSVLIDHHLDPDKDAADIVFSDISISSTCELCYEILTRVGFKISVNMAEALFAGIITDTGKLSYSSSHPEVYRVVADLIEKGINKEKIYHEIYENTKLDSIRLIGHALRNKLEVMGDTPVAFISLCKKELYQYNFQSGDTEDLVNVPLTIKGIVVSALFTQKKNGLIKISLRSKGNIPINEFAKKYFNGGGHYNAAGGEFYDKLENVIEIFKIKIKDFLKKYKI
ncbi:MAG: bifunctional oligoribonuclease/PAP phosphatase NrnA [Marinilabiliaceae bacterium]|nr:bifunctional oligoribonuclease/PAP phosphatase NrnA [Marinilabiliaceae bacterium]